MKLYGKYRGIVFDNEDPKKMLRIRAIVPVISEKPLMWALPCVDYLGADSGSIKIPGKNDGVWIEFEGGDVNYPIWSGMWASKKDIPQEFLNVYNEKSSIEKDKNGNYILITENEIKQKIIKDIIVEVLKKINLTATEIKLNNGSKGGARLDDKVKSDTTTDSSYWSWLQGFIAVFQSWTPVPQDGGAALKSLLSAFFSSNPVPQELISKIIEASGSILLGD